MCNTLGAEVRPVSQRNVTITLPEDILREARHIAVDKGVSLSRFLAQILEQQVRDTRAYNQARESALARLRLGMNLGTQGKISWTRDELYER